MKSNCNTCQYNQGAELIKTGDSLKNSDYTIALAGNPNTGKSTVFNYLTGLRQHTGNWPGKTVTSAQGSFSYLDKNFRVIDLPGTYSLLSTSDDEEVARNYILFGKPNVTVIIVDANRLERNLNLALQILEITENAVLCVNLMDEARRHKIILDERTLARDLGIPIVLTSARSGEGMNDLLQVIYDMAAGKIKTKPHRIQEISATANQAILELSTKINQLYPNLPNSRWIAMRLLEGDESILIGLKHGTLGELK